MFAIALQLDEEIPCDPESLLGSITFSDDAGILHEHDTFLDSWLYACVVALDRLSREDHICVDLVDEPDPLYFDRHADRIVIRYRNGTVTAHDVRELQIAMKRAILQLQGTLAVCSHPPRGEMWLVLELFAAK